MASSKLAVDGDCVSRRVRLKIAPKSATKRAPASRHAGEAAEVVSEVEVQNFTAVVQTV